MTTDEAARGSHQVAVTVAKMQMPYEEQQPWLGECPYLCNVAVDVQPGARDVLVPVVRPADVAQRGEQDLPKDVEVLRVDVVLDVAQRDSLELHLQHPRVGDTLHNQLHRLGKHHRLHLLGLHKVELQRGRALEEQREELVADVANVVVVLDVVPGLGQGVEVLGGGLHVAREGGADDAPHPAPRLFHLGVEHVVVRQRLPATGNPSASDPIRGGKGLLQKWQNTDNTGANIKPKLIYINTIFNIYRYIIT